MTSNLNVPSFMFETILSKTSIILEDVAVMFVMNLHDTIMQELVKLAEGEIPNERNDEIQEKMDLVVDENAEIHKPNLKVGIIMKFNIIIYNVEITLIGNNESILTAEINDLKLETWIRGSNSIECDFDISFIEIRDNRKDVLLNKIVCNPLLQPVGDDEFADAQEELKQLSVHITKDDKAKIKVFMNDLRIIVPSDIIEKLSNFTKHISPKSSTKQLETKPKNDAKVLTSENKISSTNIEFLGELQNISLLLPLSTNDLSQRVGCFNLSVTMKYNAKKTVEGNDYVSYDEHCEIEFSKINTVIGLFFNNSVRNTHQKKEFLLEPTQFVIIFNKFLQENELLSEIKISIDKVHLELGFRDFEFANQLIKNFKQISPASDSSNHESLQRVPQESSQSSLKQPTTKIFLNLAAVELRLSDDTVFISLPLIFLSISQLAINASIRSEEKSVNLCCRLQALCYNCTKTETKLEPLIES